MARFQTRGLIRWGQLVTALKIPMKLAVNTRVALGMTSRESMNNQSPNALPAKHGSREQEDNELNRYKREPCAPVGRGNVENWWDAAEKLGWTVTLRVLQDVMDGKLDPRAMNAFDALRLLAACQGYKIRDSMEFEKLEEMVDQVVERRYMSSPGPGSYSRRCKGYGGHYVEFEV